MVSSLPDEFAVAYRRFWAPIRSKCHRILGRSALADEVAQEAFIRLWESGPSLDKSMSGTGTTENTRTIMAWLYVTSTRLAIDALREGRVAPLLATADGGGEEARPCGAPGSDAIAHARSAIVALSKKIPADELEAALLTRVDGLSQPEVAKLLDVSERTIRRFLESFDVHSAELRKEVVG